MKPAIRPLPFLAAIAGLAALLALAGCSRQVLREADVPAGDYYTEDEYRRLSGEQRERYCADLAAELDRVRAPVVPASPAGESEALAALRTELARLEVLVLGADGDLGALRAEIAAYEALPDSYVVQPGDDLMGIAAQERIYADPRKWPRLARANRAQIADPGRIRPQQVLVVPRDWPRQHRVVAGEWLSKIAGYWEIYDDALAWPRLYEANRDQIANPDLIRPDQVLAVPR
jgi:nucleoid-associated protein YgaU